MEVCLKASKQAQKKGSKEKDKPAFNDSILTGPYEVSWALVKLLGVSKGFNFVILSNGFS